MTREEEIIKASQLYASPLQKPFMDGAMWADKTILIKATEWLSANLHRYDESIGLGVKEFVEKFSKEVWQQPPVNLWKPADGDYLPEIDREVIVLLTNDKVCFAHRPNPNGWDGESITTGEVKHYTPKTYEKGGWNIPNIKWWCDINLPKEGGEE